MLKEEFDRRLKEYTHECPSCNCGIYKVFESKGTTLSQQIKKYIKSRIGTIQPLYPNLTGLGGDEQYYSQYALNYIWGDYVFINSPLLGHGVGIAIEELIKDL